MERRYTIRRAGDDRWDVYDIDDGEAVVVEGVALTDLLGEDALDALGLLKEGFLRPGRRTASAGRRRIGHRRSVGRRSG